MKNPRHTIFLAALSLLFLSAAFSRPTAAFPEDMIQGIRYLYSFNAETSGSPLGNIGGIYFERTHDELYILDHRLRRVVLTDADGVFIYSFKYTDAGLQALPSDIAVNSEGDIYISEHGRVMVLSFRGVYKRALDLSGVPDASSLDIQSMTFDDEGRLYIGSLNRLIVLDKEGNYLFHILADEQANFKNVGAIEVVESGIYILDPAQFSVFRFDREGNFLSRFGKLSGLSGGFSLPVDMSFDRRKERVVVVDLNRYMVIFFNTEGRYLFELGGPTTFNRPSTVTMDERGRFYVSDTTQTVRVFTLIEK
jgi:hypothetical protein